VKCGVLRVVIPCSLEKNPNVSEDHIFSTFRVEEKAKQETNISRRKLELAAGTKSGFIQATSRM
jgi:hypothetical protein